MSDTVKLIIEIPKELHEALLNGYEEPYSRMFSDAVKNGTQLDDVKAEIESAAFTDWEGDAYIYVPYAFEILDNIGKESEG